MDNIFQKSLKMHGIMSQTYWSIHSTGLELKNESSLKVQPQQGSPVLSPTQVFYSNRSSLCSNVVDIDNQKRNFSLAILKVTQKTFFS